MSIYIDMPTANILKYFKIICLVCIWNVCVLRRDEARQKPVVHLPLW